MIRLCSLSVKAIVAAIKSDKLFCRHGAIPSVSASGGGESDAAFAVSELSQDAASGNSSATAVPRTSSSVAFYRRKVCLANAFGEPKG